MMIKNTLTSGGYCAPGEFAPATRWVAENSLAMRSSAKMRVNRGLRLGKPSPGCQPVNPGC
ncbi:MAG: hypothetical protein CMM29_00545 [Rhodospirillaceae bacterium]|nr:hypothetical protein [Rhodospirillaceae bacterium]